MSARRRPLSPDEIARAFGGAAAERFPVILSPAQLADLAGLSPKTIYEWIARGRLERRPRLPPQLKSNVQNLQARNRNG